MIILAVIPHSVNVLYQQQEHASIEITTSVITAILNI